jgi:hypothetical protein
MEKPLASVKIKFNLVVLYHRSKAFQRLRFNVQFCGDRGEVLCANHDFMRCKIT